MQNKINDYHCDPDELAEEFLIVNCIFDPADQSWRTRADINPDLLQHLSRGVLENGAFLLKYWRAEFYKWVNGRYVQVSDSQMKCWIKRYLHCANELAKSNPYYADRYVTITGQRIANIMLCIAGTDGVFIPETDELNSWQSGQDHGHAVVFNNGIVYFDEQSGGSVKACHACPEKSRGELSRRAEGFVDGSSKISVEPDHPQAALGDATHGGKYVSGGSLNPDAFIGIGDGRYGRPRLGPHHPDFFTLIKLPYDYDPAAECRLWQEFLFDVMEGDAERIKLLQQWAGYLLMPTTKQQKFMLIAGEGQNGKTVFTTILEKMVGEDNVSHVPLSQFSSQFALAPTLGKVLNSTSESSHCLDEVAETTLKSYTSGDRMTFQRKYKEPIHARPTARIMISTNQLPAFADKSMGIWRRMLFVPFEKSYPQQVQNHNLIDELSAELPGIFNWAYDGLKLLGEQGGFIMPEKCRQAIQQYRRDVNPARAFLLDNYVTGLDYEGLPCQEVYQAYVQWCLDNGFRPMNNTNFGKEVKRALPNVGKERHRRDGRQIYVYFGISVREDSEIAQPGFCTESRI